MSESSKQPRDILMERLGDFVDKWALPGSESEMLRDLMQIVVDAGEFGAAAATEGALKGVDRGIEQARKTLEL